MSGHNLKELEQTGLELGLIRRSTLHCEFARKFVLRVVPDLAYAFRLPWLIVMRRGHPDVDALGPLSHLGTAVELGVDSESKIEFLRESILHTRTGAHRASN